MNWSERMIARAIARQTFKSKYLAVVPNCNWTGHECDLLVVTDSLRIIDVEIKISRADLKADAKKTKWWTSYAMSAATGRYTRVDPPEPKSHPPKVWKHYYAMPLEIWRQDLADFLPSPASGIILLHEQRSTSVPLAATIERRATPNRDATVLSPAAAIDIARMASLRMWDAYQELDSLRAKPSLDLEAA